MKGANLEVGYPHCCNHSKHNEEHSSNNRVWDGDKNCSKLPKDPQDDHQNASCLDDQSAANLAENEHRDLLIIVYKWVNPSFSPCQLYFLPGQCVGEKTLKSMQQFE